MQCPICGETSWSSDVDLGAWAYVTCDSCRLRRLDPFPTQDESLALYDDGYFTTAGGGGYDDYVADARVHRRNGRARVRRLGPPRRPGAHLVDVGCAFGFTMLEARRAGWDPVGVEVNATARSAVQADGMRCAPTIADLGLERGTVDAVAFFQVLEHLADPLGALGDAATALRSHGDVVVETWDASSRTARVFGSRWQQLNPPSVLWLFDRATLGALADAAGLELVSWRWTTKWVSLGLVLGQLDRQGVVGPAPQRMRGLPIPYVLGDLVTARLRSR